MIAQDLELFDTVDESSVFWASFEVKEHEKAMREWLVESFAKWKEAGVIHELVYPKWEDGSGVVREDEDYHLSDATIEDFLADYTGQWEPTHVPGYGREWTTNEYELAREVESGYFQLLESYAEKKFNLENANDNNSLCDEICEMAIDAHDNLLSDLKSDLYCTEGSDEK